MATTTISTTNIIQMTVNDNDYNSHFEGNLLDISADPEAYYRVVLFGYITPIFFLITLAANILIVLVLSRPTMRSPTNLVLLSMAVADLLTLIFPVPWYFYMYTLGYYKFLLYPALSCNLYHVMSEILPTFFHTASIWCTLLLACQRYVYICHPTLAKVWCTNQRVTRTILAIFLLASVHQLLRIMPTIMDDNSIIMNTNNESMINNEPQKACRQVIAKWTTSIENLYFGTYFVFRIVFVHIGPCFLLVIFNVLLYNALKRAEKTRNKLLNKQQSTEQRNGSSGWNKQQQQQQQSDDHQQQRKANRGRDANSTTVMLIVVVTVFLIVEIPLAVATAIHVTENMFTVDIVSDRFLSMTIIFSNFFIIISYPLNFAIYCGMSRAFRETFQQMFLKNLFTIRLTARSSSLNPFISTATTTSTTTNTTTTTTTLSSSNTATATTLTRMKNISSASSKGHY
ncbi:7 transmembrane receptor -like protein 6 [Dermatophagoides farinae]|uniref:7 transmembrane receptor -like protein 6 n=1 Tax=Dermatophagoides farinae TaxID=6954 RepID=A0A9D4NP26_DERFA|nr:7 transmembrane receptor -like protein 6 [Dermatophagoides farinae]